MASTRKKRARPSQITWFHRYLKNSVNQIFAWSPYRRESRKRALVRREYDPTTGVWVEKFKCEMCEAVVGRDKIHCDHKVPREGLGEWDGWGPYIDRALEHGGPAGLQWICTSCHHIKTQEENKVRRKARGKKNNVE